MAGLYIHIPFCRSKCTYCDFYSRAPHSNEEVSLFLKALEIELQHLPPEFVPETIFIGGGTPTSLECSDLEHLFHLLHDTLNLSAVNEFSCEANPGTLSLEKLRLLRSGGVDRLSLGVQSFNEKALQLLGRIHTASEAEEAVHMAREVGFPRISLDLIQSIPGLSQEEILADHRRALALQPEHLSTYNLSYESDTPLFRAKEEGKIMPISEECEERNYFVVKELLELEGFIHYEISNYAKPQAICRHNMLYWTGGEYFGCGPAAHSHWKGTRFGNVADLSQYAHRLLNNESPVEHSERLPAEKKARETLAMHLRLLQGVDEVVFTQQTGFSASDLFGDSLKLLIEEGLLIQSKGRLRIAPSACFISNTIYRELMSE